MTSKKLRLLNFRKKLIDNLLEVANNSSNSDDWIDLLYKQWEYLNHFIFHSDELEKLLGVKK